MSKRLLFTLFLTGCDLLGGRDRQPPEETDTAADTADTDVVDTDTGFVGPCSPEMALVDDSFCVDRWEAHTQEFDGSQWAPSSPYDTIGPREVRAVSTAGAVPQAYISADEAAVACEAAGKRLCSSTEWLASCRSPDGRTYPYGNIYAPDNCNDTYEGGHPVVDFFGTSEGVWDSAHLNDPGINQQPNTVALTGQKAGCVSDSGVFDLHGNVHEWVEDADGTFRGGFYADGELNGPGCTYVTTAHSSNYHDYSTGFRCCSDAR